jgi:hypothetical protein
LPKRYPFCLSAIIAGDFCFIDARDGEEALRIARCHQHHTGRMNWQDEFIVSSPTTPATYCLTFVTEPNVAR